MDQLESIYFDTLAETIDGLAEVLEELTKLHSNAQALEDEVYRLRNNLRSVFHPGES